MNSIDNKCNELKWKYDECFNNWMSSEYLGSDKKFEEGFVPCQKLFSPYQDCVQTALNEANVDLSETIETVKEKCARDLEAAEEEIEKNKKSEKNEN
jgi:hypothetical protein